jgi:hypothetical protein
MTTTSAATKGARTARAAGKTARAAEPAQPTVTGQPAVAAVLAPEALARTLRAVADELERDPDLARRVAAAIRDALTQGDAPLRAVVDEVAAPAEEPAPDTGNGAAKTPSTRKARAFKPTLVTGTDPALGTGVLDPVALRERLGADGLRQALRELRLGSLRAIIREHRLDAGGKLAGVNDAEKLRGVILDATRR